MGGFPDSQSKTGKRLPIVLSQQEVEALFGAIKNLKHRAILMTIYSAGLRISEALQLKLSDIDSQRMTIRVEHGKGNKDRYTLLGKRNLDILREYWKKYRPQDWLFCNPSRKRPLSTNAVRRVFYKALNLLFKAVSETLSELARDSKHLRAEIGFMAILHTWSQTLIDHPHLYCLVTGGGLSLDGKQWICSKRDFFIPAKVLSSFWVSKRNFPKR